MLVNAGLPVEDFAPEYMGNLGYLQRDRADAPDAIRETTEFSALCPGDAVLMSKAL